ncbi:MAG TPA: universal stress protein [Ktedonobacteraceae bacterium]|jgi:nucleotide-binding universal stress UspA family protein|nr:universal stress protein [Ktedonobacteraceae bacterium]
MVHLWGSRAKEESQMSKSALGESAKGDVAVVVCGDRLDTNLISLGCLLAKGAKRKVHFVRVIEVPRALPLKAVLSDKSEQASQLLNDAMEIARKVGCEAVAEVVQAREAGPAIVEEATDHHCSLLLISSPRRNHVALNDFGKTIAYVLDNAPCRVCFMQDPTPQAQAQAQAAQQAAVS